MKKLLSTACAVLTIAAAVATPAGASGTGAGYISSIYSLGGGVILFTLSGSRSATPTCHTIPGRWAFDGSTAAGQHKLAIILTAHATGKQVLVDGLGSCNVWGDTETVNLIVTAD